MKLVIWWMWTWINPFSEPKPGLDTLCAAVCIDSWFATDYNFPVAFLVSVQEKQVRLKLNFLAPAKSDWWIFQTSLVSSVIFAMLDYCLLETKLSLTYPEPSWERRQAQAKESQNTLYQSRLMSCKARFTPLTLLKEQQWWSIVLLRGTGVWHDTGPSCVLNILGWAVICNCCHSAQKRAGLTQVTLYFFCMFLHTDRKILFRFLHLLTLMDILAP